MEGGLCDPIAVERRSKMKTKMNNFLSFCKRFIHVTFKEAFQNLVTIFHYTETVKSLNVKIFQFFRTFFSSSFRTSTSGDIMVNRKISAQKRADIISALRSNKTYNAIKEEFGVSKGTISKIAAEIQHYSENKVGRPQCLSTQEARLVLRKFSIGDFRNAEEAAKSLRSLGTQISAQTVRNLLSAANFKAVYKRPVSPLTTVRKKARLQFARKYTHWTGDDWRHVVFSDETKVNRLGSDGKQWTWIQEGRPLQDHNVNHVYKHGGGSIFLWSCFTAKGPGYITEILGGLDSKLYCQILSEDLMATLDDYHLNTADIVFQQDNDPKHRSKLAAKLFQENNVKLLEWPAYSPDLNPIENLWDFLKVRLCAYETEPKSMHELFERVRQIWYNEVTPELCDKLICSMPDRLRKVIKANGGQIDY